MKNFLRTIGISLCLALSSASFAENTAKKPEVDYLYVQIAPQAVLKEVDSKTKTYELTLMEVNQHVEYFSDRPERIAGIMKVNTFLDEWNKSFKKTPPNVSLTGLEKKVLRRVPISVIVELTNPIYNAEKKIITYTVKLLPDESVPSKEIKFHGIALFFDNYCASCVANGF